MLERRLLALLVSGVSSTNDCLSDERPRHRRGRAWRRGDLKHHAEAVAFLNAYLSPWTFKGDEPITLALEQLLVDAADDAIRGLYERGVMGCQTPPLSARIKNP